MITVNELRVSGHHSGGQLRQETVTRLRKRPGLEAHVLAYVLINVMLINIWLVATPGGLFWPVVPLVGWGIGVAFHAWNVYARPAPKDERVQRQMQHMGRP